MKYSFECPGTCDWGTCDCEVKVGAKNDDDGRTIEEHRSVRHKKMMSLLYEI